MSTDVTVFGGTGFVGSRVVKSLVEKGASVTSVSKSGSIPKWCKEEEWTKSVQWKSADLLSGNEAGLDEACGSPVAVVSCVGVVGTDPDVLKRGNGDANVAAFASAKRGGKLERAVYVSVSSEVDACKDNWLPDFFKSYFEGKIIAERAAVDSVGDAKNVCLVKPTFIYGGPDFGLLPPRVNFEYGSGVEELLFLPPFKILADITPGLIKVALRPPVCVDSVAAACAKAALNEVGADLPTLDGTKEINAYSGQPKSTGLTDALEWSKEKLVEFYEWAKVEVPKAVDAIQTKIDEAKK
jgi:nucleoside-diphosphate-sugar epimerase